MEPDPAEDLDFLTTATVDGTDLIVYNDENLRAMLASVVIKMTKSPCAMQDQNRMQAVFERHCMHWSRVQMHRHLLRLVMPESDDEKIVFLGRLGRGRSGTVHLCTTLTYRVCAIKFAHYVKRRNGKDNMDLATELQRELDIEAAVWNTVYPRLTEGKCSCAPWCHRRGPLLMAGCAG